MCGDYLLTTTHKPDLGFSDMAEKSKKATPPYATFSSFINFINKLREGIIPSRIDPSVFGNASGSVSYSIIASLKTLKLISSDGTPAEAFNSFVKASDEDRRPMMKSILKIGFPTLWGDSINVSTTSAGQFDEHIREEYDAKGSTVDKVAAFFISAAKYAEVELSPHLKARKSTASSASSGKSKRQRKTADLDGNGNGNAAPQTPPATSMSDKALEYKLVDLMKEEGVGNEERNAIWTLIQYLTAKGKSQSAPSTSKQEEGLEDL
jgi:Family of unknown function (DUF5343)